MNRRSFLGLLAAPAIIRVADLMPIKAPRIIAKSPLLGQPYGMVQFVGNPVTTYEQYAAECLRRIASGVGVPFYQLTGDFNARYQSGGSGDGDVGSGSGRRSGRDEDLLRRLAEA